MKKMKGLKESAIVMLVVFVGYALFNGWTATAKEWFNVPSLLLAIIVLLWHCGSFLERLVDAVEKPQAEQVEEAQ